MMQGDSDTTIPVKQAYSMEEKAKKVGAPVTTIIIKNTGHNWRKVGKILIQLVNGLCKKR